MEIESWSSSKNKTEKPQTKKTVPDKNIEGKKEK